jgi:hypothetical protein
VDSASTHGLQPNFLACTLNIADSFGNGYIYRGHAIYSGTIAIFGRVLIFYIYIFEIFGHGPSLGIGLLKSNQLLECQSTEWECTNIETIHFQMNYIQILVVFQAYLH